MGLKQLTQARWFPTVSKPLLTGLIASGVVFGLHAVGITNFTSSEVNAAAAPLVGFLVAAMAQKPTPDAKPEQQPDFIHTIVPILVPNAEQLLRDHPELLQELLNDAIKVSAPKPPPPTTPTDSPDQTGVFRG